MTKVKLEIWSNDILLFYILLVTQCASPTAVIGSSYSCTGYVNYLGTCELTCDAGYTGAKTLTCNQHTSGVATSTWDGPVACTSKHTFYIYFMVSILTQANSVKKIFRKINEKDE